METYVQVSQRSTGSHRPTSSRGIPMWEMAARICGLATMYVWVSSSGLLRSGKNCVQYEEQVCSIDSCIVLFLEFSSRLFYNVHLW